MIARRLAPAQFVQHGARGTVERRQAAVGFGRPAMMLDLIGAFDSVLAAGMAVSVGADKDHEFPLQFRAQSHRFNA